MIAENGAIIAENERFRRDSNITYGEIDCERLKFERSLDHAVEECTSAYTNRGDYTYITTAPLRTIDMKKDKLLRKYRRNPFVPSNQATIDERCEEIFKIQTAGLAKRIEHAHAKTAVVGISGGLDSTLALLVCVETFKMLGRDTKNIIAVTMPGFGTTDKTYNNALTIMKLLGTDVREISIADAVMEMCIRDRSTTLSTHTFISESVCSARNMTPLRVIIASIVCLLFL